MKVPLSLAVMAVVLALAVGAFASPSGDDSVLYLGQVYCQGLEYCPDFATWGGTAAGYVELLDKDGKTISDYLWVDYSGHLFFESAPLNTPPPSGLPFLGSLIENGQLQEVDQFFPGGVTRPLFIQSNDVPEPSTLLLFGPAALFLFGRARRFWRG